MFLNGWLSWLKAQSRSTKRAPSRRCSPLSEGGVRDWLLEDRCVPAVAFPTPNARLNQIFWHGGAPLAGANDFPPGGIPSATTPPPLKTVTFYNNSPVTIYPFFRDANTGQFNDNGTMRPYDPQDHNGGIDPMNSPALKGAEFRAYIGYNIPSGPDAGNYVGLLPGASMTVVVPLVFWDGATIQFATDAKDFFNTQATGTAVIDTTTKQLTSITITNGGGGYLAPPNVTFSGVTSPAAVPIVTAKLTNGVVTGFDIIDKGSGIDPSTIIVKIDPPPAPFRYSLNSLRGFGNESVDPTNSVQWVANYSQTQGTKGLVMFYYDQVSAGPSPDAPSQLTEYTIRDPYLRSFNIPDSSGQTLVVYNYDVSYVDSMISPIAMEATNVPVVLLPDVARGRADLVGGPGGGVKVVVTSQGTGYNGVPPAVTIGRPQQNGGTQATAHAEFQNGVLVVVMDNPGTGYTGNPGVVFSYPPGPTPPPSFGWVGAQANFATLQEGISDFIAKGNHILGSYFGTDQPGWPVYYNPTLNTATPTDLKIPSGANIFLDSPLTGKRSSFDQNRWLQTSSGLGPVEAFPNGTTNGTGTVIAINGSASQVTAFFDLLQKMTANNQEVLVNTSGTPFAAPLAKVVSFDPNAKTVTVSAIGQGLPGGVSNTYTIYRPVKDYAATAITNIWFGWAEFYQKMFANFQPVSNITGSVQQFKPAGDTPKVPGNILTIKPGQVPAGTLKLGMQVTGPGIHEVGPGFPPVVIIGLDDYVNPTKILLSQLVTTDVIDGQYSFLKPPDLQGATDWLTQTDPATGKPWITPVNIQFSGQTDQEKLETQRFAAAVYAAMYVESTIPTGILFKEAKLPHAMALVGTVIGFDALHLPNSNPSQGDIGGNLRDVVKSILRGVYDFREIPDERNWYPAPGTADPRSVGVNFNVFNLDPYVFFVHKVLGLSGYGFSIDDDAADVGAFGFPLPRTGILPNNLSISYAGLQGLPNSKEWFPSVPYGEITATAKITQYYDDKLKKNLSVITFQDSLPFSQVKFDAPLEGFVGAYVSIPSKPGTLPVFLRLAGPGPGGEEAKTFILSDHVDDMPFTTFKFTGKPASNSVDPILNGSFEVPKLPDGTFKWDPTDASPWVWGNPTQGPNNEAVAANASGYTAGNPVAPDGVQVAAIQKRGSVSQTVQLDAGVYTLSFYVAQRWGTNGVENQGLNILVAPVSDPSATKVYVAKFPKGRDDPNAYTYRQTSVTFDKLPAGTYIITIQGTNDGFADNDHDNTALIDVVRLERALTDLPEADVQPVLFRATAGTFFEADTQSNYNPETTDTIKFGAPGDVPLNGDWYGVGDDTYGVFRPSTGTWYLNTTDDDYDPEKTIVFQFGMLGDIPVVGDWLGDGKTHIGVFRPSTGTWYLNTLTPFAGGAPGSYDPANTIQIQFGTLGDIPVIGHWLGGDFDRIGVFRPSTGTWYLDQFGGSDSYRSVGIGNYDAAVTAVVQFGAFGDVPVVGDWQGTGVSHIGVYRPSTGQWFLDTQDRAAGASAYTSATAIQILYGTPGDEPLVGTWVDDGIDHIGIFRPSTGTWFLDKANRPVGELSGYSEETTTAFQFGAFDDEVEFF
ncbi:MAG: hypothetical protein K2R98_24795 [Gemmataceae bacterium]|nr:hypothetical protein [Gemmataceae bacterium]